MATLKDLIRAETLAGGARGSAIDTSAYISVTPPAEGESVDYIAPCDGVVRVAGEYKTKDAWNSIWTWTNDTNQNGLALGGSSGWITFCSRVKKGDKVTVGNSGKTAISVTEFFKVIGGGYKRYLPSLSRSRFGGALWLRLKTTSETLRRLEVASRSRVGKLLISNLSVRPRELGAELTSHLRTGILPYLLMQRPVLLPKSFLAMPASSCHRILQRSGLDALSLVGRGKSVNTPCTVMGSFKERRCSFIPRVACNNARMEVAA